MDDEDAHQTLESLLAKLEGLEKCVGLLGKVIIDHLPEAGAGVIGGFESFARHARKANQHETEIDLYERMAEWLRRDAEIRAGGNPRTGPRTRT